MASQPRSLRLNAHLLHLLETCPRCFWENVRNNRKLPKIWDPLRSVVDAPIKKVFERARSRSDRGTARFPKQVRGLLPGSLVDTATVRFLRGRLSATIEGVYLSTRIEDAVEISRGSTWRNLAPLSYSAVGAHTKEMHVGARTRMTFDVAAFLIDNEDVYKEFSRRMPSHYLPICSFHFGFVFRPQLFDGTWNMQFRFRYALLVRRVRLNPGRIFVLLDRACELFNQRHAPAHASACSLR